MFVFFQSNTEKKHPSKCISFSLACFNKAAWKQGQAGMEQKSRGLEIITCRSFLNFLAGVRIFASFLPPLYNFCFHFTLGNTILSACSFDVRRYSAKVAWKQDSFAQPLENIVVFICTFFYKFYYFWQTVFQSGEGEQEVEGGL